MQRSSFAYDTYPPTLEPEGMFVAKKILGAIKPWKPPGTSTWHRAHTAPVEHSEVRSFRQCASKASPLSILYKISNTHLYSSALCSSGCRRCDGRRNRGRNCGTRAGSLHVSLRRRPCGGATGGIFWRSRAFRSKLYVLLPKVKHSAAKCQAMRLGSASGADEIVNKKLSALGGLQV